MSVPSLSRGKHIAAFAAYLRKLGLPVDPALNRSGLPYNSADEPEMVLPVQPTFRFYDHVAQLTNNPAVGIEVLNPLSLDHLGDFGAAITKEATLYRALLEFHRRVPSETSIHQFELHQHDKTILFTHTCVVTPQTPGSWDAALYTTGWMLKIVNYALPDWSPEHIAFAGDETPKRRSATSSLNCSSVTFGETRTGFSIPRSWLSAPMRRRESMKSVRSEAKARTLVGLHKNLPATLREILTSYGQDRWLDINELAEISDMRKRTIQRHLAKDGVSYSALVESARFEYAGQLLESSQMPIVEIADALGYSHHPNFSRAFHGWAGVSPQAFRSQRMALQ